MKQLVTTILYQPLFNALMFLVWLVPNQNVGLAIIALTLIVRFALLAPSLKALRSQKKLQDLQPELQKIQDKYKDDKQKQAQAVMEFYKENNVSPLGSCLPTLIQLPILIVLYYVFIHGLDTSRFSLLYSWMPRPDFIQTMFLGIDLAKPDRWILPIIAGLLQFYQAYQITPKTKPGEGQEIAMMVSKQMMYLMPVFTVLIAGRFPAALPLYWIVTTAFAIVQQWIVYRESPPTTADRLPKNIEKKQSFFDKVLERAKNNQKIDKNAKKTIKNGVEVTVRKKK